MKTLIPLIFVMLTFACNSSDLQVGDCVQKPDEVFVWKITNIDGSKMEIGQSQSPQIPSSKTVEISSNWIKTSCQD